MRHNRVRVLPITTSLLIALLLRSEASASSTSPGANLPRLPGGYRWQSISELSDEFSGNALDTAKWRPSTSIWNGRRPSHFSAENVSVSGGYLLLKTSMAVASLSEIKDSWRDVWINAAVVSSVKPIATFGYYEARFRASRLPTTSSFWLQNDLNATQRVRISEIDVAEQSGAARIHPERNRRMLMNTHFSSHGWSEAKGTPRDAALSSGSGDQYHVYGAWWKDERTVWFYADDVKVAEVTTAGPFTDPMYMYFDTEPFKSRGLPTPEELGQSDRNTMSVDWVRSWRVVQAPNGK